MYIKRKGSLAHPDSSVPFVSDINNSAAMQTSKWVSKICLSYIVANWKEGCLFVCQRGTEPDVV